MRKDAAFGELDWRVKSCRRQFFARRVKGVHWVDALHAFALGLGLLVGVDDAGLALFEGGLRCRAARREQTEGRAGDVVEADLVAELDGLRIAAVLATDADF